MKQICLSISLVVEKAKEAREKYQAEANASISEKTKRSQQIILEWQKSCCENSQLEAGDPNSAQLSFALHDKEHGIVYELKSTTTNPRTQFFKAICKAIAYNSETPSVKIQTIYFLAPKAAISNLSIGVPRILTAGNCSGMKIMLVEI